MKISIRKLFVLLAIAMSLLAVQAAWAHVESIEGPSTVYGTVAYASGDKLAIACNYTPYFGVCPLIISGMGPAGWWSENDVTFPANGSAVTISFYIVTTDYLETKYVASEVTNSEGESIVLHILFDDMLYSAWTGWPPDTKTTILSTTATAATDCTTCDNCYLDCLDECDGEVCDCVSVCVCPCDGTGVKNGKGPKK